MLLTARGNAAYLAPDQATPLPQLRSGLLIVPKIGALRLVKLASDDRPSSDSAFFIRV